MTTMHVAGGLAVRRAIRKDRIFFAATRRLPLGHLTETLAGGFARRFRRPLAQIALGHDATHRNCARFRVGGSLPRGQKRNGRPKLGATERRETPWLTV